MSGVARELASSEVPAEVVATEDVAVAEVVEAPAVTEAVADVVEAPAAETAVETTDETTENK